MDTDKTMDKEMDKAMDKTNVMGFDRYQIAAIKRTAANNKLQLKKANKISDKINELNKQLDTINNAIGMWETPIKQLSKKVTGYELTSNEILSMYKDEEAWNKYKYDHSNDLNTIAVQDTENNE